METRNSMRYRALASRMRCLGWEGVADFFDAEAKGEAHHARKVQRYIERRNECLDATLVFTETFVSATMVDAFAAAMVAETDTTAALQVLYDAAQGLRDSLTVEWLRELLNIQAEEENTYQTINDRIDRRAPIDGTAEHDIDVWVAKVFG
jgi:ferritin